jgi:acyl-CoA synthetase (AMP-forming)/AMP-acid ligase II
MQPFASLIELLQARARNAGEQTAFLWQERPWSYGELWEALESCAGQFLGLGLAPGTPLLLALPNDPAFFAAFFGAQRAGLVPVPLCPDSGSGRLADIASHARARALVVAPDQLTRRRAELETRRLRVLASDPQGPAPSAERLYQPTAEDLCLIQYTSGSTGDPKGVQLSHANVLANLAQLSAGMRITRGDVFVSWLPLYHDMGLILMALVPFFLGAGLVLLPARLTRVRDWLRAIEHYRASLTAAPDFAYRFCLRQLRPDQHFDLSSLRLALNAAEPVRAGTIRDFEQRFGLGPVMLPGYGLAEASVGVSTWIPGRPVRVDGAGLVSVGPPFPGVEVRIDTPVPPHRLGEILVRSASNSRGYLYNPRASAELRAPDGFIRTGDLGYLDADGYLYCGGRLKEIIVQGGRNIAPQEAEELMDALPWVRRSAAVAIERSALAGEQAHLFAELRPQAGVRALETHHHEIVQAFHQRFGFRPGRVLLLAPHSIPRTANGKLQRGLLRRRLLDGELRRRGQILFPLA